MLITPYLVSTLTATGVVAAVATTVRQRAPDCQLVTFSVTVSAQNEVYSHDLDPNNATSIDQFVDQALHSGRVKIDGTLQLQQNFSISAQYCVPAGSADQPISTIQVLLHGNTNNRKIWDGLGLSSLQDSGYSWQSSAAAAGQATLALDMIGHGASTLSDPNTIVQMPMEAAIVNQITTALRSPNNPLSQEFDKVVFIGHSFGAITGIATARLFPKFANAMVLVGWSSSLPLPSPLLALQMHSAQLLESRFKDLPLGYLTASNKNGSINTFFAGNFDQAVAAAHFDQQDVMTTGEGGSIGEGLQPASFFTGPVLAVTGSDDILFCNPANGGCAVQLTNSKVLLPNATSFDTHVIPYTGHSFLLHYSSRSTFKFIQNWLDTKLE